MIRKQVLIARKIVHVVNRGLSNIIKEEAEAKGILFDDVSDAVQDCGNALSEFLVLIL